jgi:sugar phosphate isomerase/epimerase
LKLADLACDGCHIWEDDAAKRGEYAEKAWANIAAGEALGAKTIRIDAGGARPAMEFTSEQFDTIVAAYKKMAKRAEDGGYKLGPENHWGPDCVPGVMKKLCEAVASPAFGVLLHMGRWKGDDAAQGDEMIAPWGMHSHFGPAMSAEDTAAKMAMLRDAGYKGYYGIEMVSDSYAELASQIARIKAVLDRWRIEAKC